MGLSRFIALLALLGLSFISALMFESIMTKSYVVELFVIILGVIFSIIALVSLLNDGAGGWFMATLIFGAALVNGIVLFLMVKSFALLMLSIIVNITGMIFSVLSAVETDEDDFDIETYGVDNDDDKDEEDYVEVASEKPKRKYAKRKTAKRKYTKRN